MLDATQNVSYNPTVQQITPEMPLGDLAGQGT